MKSVVRGHQAEAVVAEYLKSKGYEILELNWKTKACEIDIIAKKDKVVYLVEVKYRGSAAQGDGLEYIGPQKLKRLHFAAEIWAQAAGWDGDYRLMAASVTGDDYKIQELIEII